MDRLYPLNHPLVQQIFTVCLQCSTAMLVYGVLLVNHINKVSVLSETTVSPRWGIGGTNK